MSKSYFTSGSIIKLALLILLINVGLKVADIVDQQDKHIKKIHIYTPDLPNLPMTRLQSLEQEKEQIFNILDPKTGRLKYSGWMKRDQNISFNRELVQPDPNSFFLREWTKIKHLTLIITFSKKKISIIRLFDIGVNTLMVATHILKGGNNFNENDPFATITDDLTTKEISAIIYSDRNAVGLREFNVSSSYETLIVSEKKDFDKNKYEKVYNLYEKCVHPHQYEFNYDIFIEKTDEPLTLLQEQSEDGKNFIAHTSRIGLRSFGKHNYYAFRKLQDDDDETYTNILVNTGVPLFGQGKFVNLQSAGQVKDQNGNTARFGFEYVSGLSGRPGLSNANKNAFTINGKLYKLHTMDMVEGFKLEQKDEIRNLHLQMRPEDAALESQAPKCEIWFKMNFRMHASAALKILIVEEFMHQGYMKGWCETGGESSQRYEFESIDALLIFDQNVY